MTGVEVLPARGADCDPSRHRWLKLALFAVWLALVVAMAARHTLFRDEVRALSLALQGRDLGAMLAGIHGEGHPGVWYLLLRGAHALWHSPLVLPLVSIAVAAAAALLGVLRGPFAWWMVLLGLASRFALFEYSVMARNYGISVLLMFAVAALWPRRRQGGVVLGVLLALLANTNIHSVILAGAFLGVWLIEVIGEEGLRWGGPMRTFVLNAAVCTVGVIVCALTVYPPVNDAAVIAHPGGFGALDLIRAVLLPAGPLDYLLGLDPQHAPAMLRGPLGRSALEIGGSVVLYAAAFSLVRRPAACLAAVVSLVGLSVFSAVISHGFYRHDALWLCFVISLHWIGRADPAPAAPWPASFAPRLEQLAKAGGAILIALLACQAQAGVLTAAAALRAPPPTGPGSFPALVSSRPDLRQAVILADPDFLLEAMPYYLSNPTWLVREQRYGAVVHFTRRARLSLALPDLLDAARRLKAQTGRPVVILVQTPLRPAAPPAVAREGYDWELRTDPAGVTGFLGAVQPLGHFAQASEDGDFDAYLVK